MRLLRLKDKLIDQLLLTLFWWYSLIHAMRRDKSAYYPEIWFVVLGAVLPIGGAFLMWSTSFTWVILTGIATHSLVGYIATKAYP